MLIGFNGATLASDPTNAISVVVALLNEKVDNDKVSRWYRRTHEFLLSRHLVKATSDSQFRRFSVSLAKQIKCHSICNLIRRPSRCYFAKYLAAKFCYGRWSVLHVRKPIGSEIEMKKRRTLRFVEIVWQFSIDFRLFVLILN